MNKNINSKLAIAIIAFIATAVTAWFVGVEKNEERKIQTDQAAINIYQKNTAKIVTADDNQNQSASNDEWKIVSGSPDDICTIPVYEGNTVVHGWYVYDLNYEKKKEWLLRIADEDVSKLPLFENNKNSKDFHLRVRINNLSPELEKKLKKASEKDPVEVQISRYLAYCEGVPIASIESAENI